LVAGGAGVGVVIAERLSPKLTDWITGKIGFIGQTTDEKNVGAYPGSLFEPVEGFDTVEGKFSGEQIKSDPYTWLMTHPAAKNTLLAALGIAGGLFAWKKLKEAGRQEI